MRALLLLVTLAAAQAADAATYTVGPSGQYGTLTALFAAEDLGPGDIVEVAGGGAPYAGGVIVPAADGGAAGNPVVLRGVGPARPVLQGGVNTIEFRLSDHMVMEGFEITGGSFRCVYHHAHDITLRDVVIHDCLAHGVLGADEDSGSLTIEYSEIYNAGSGTTQHPVYMATDQLTHPGAVFRLQYSYLHGGNGGNLIKSRAERNEIYYNWLEGGLYHELELIGPDPQGSDVEEFFKREDSDVVGNVIVHTSPLGAFVRFGGDGTGQSNGRYRFVNNTVVGMDMGLAGELTVFRLFQGIESVDAHNNVFWREGAGGLRVVRDIEAFWTGPQRVSGTNNWIDNGSTFVPADFTGTLQGTDPGFIDAAGMDFRPSAGSPLLDSANPDPQPLPGYFIATTVDVPAFHPPLRAKPAPFAAVARPLAGTLDRGAFERADASQVFADGFED